MHESFTLSNFLKLFLFYMLELLLGFGIGENYSHKLDFFFFNLIILFANWGVQFDL